MKTAYINLTIPFKRANAFIVENGYFTHVGQKHQILRQDIDEIIDMQDQTIMPAFHDSHMHLLGLGFQRSIFDASIHKSIKSILKAMKDIDKPFILGRGFHEATMAENRSLTKDDLNHVSMTKPVVVYRACGHVLFANQRAIDLALEKNPSFKSEHMHEGIFKEEDMDFIKAIFPVPSKEELSRYILKAQAHLHKHGITSVGSDDYHIFETLNYKTVREVFKSLVEKDELKLNVLQQANLPKLTDLEDYIKRGYAHERFGSFEEGPLKLLADGSLGGHSAYMKAPYADKNTRGIEIFDYEALMTRIELARKKKMDFAIHAIGDQTVETLINIKEALGDDPLKYRDSIIHAQLADFDQIKRMAKLNLGAQTQPIFLNSDIPIIESRLQDRAKETYLFKSMISENIQTTISTDAPIEGVNPFENIYAAVSRKSIKHPNYRPFLASEAMTIKEALKAYTETPAYFAYKSQKIGQIKTGFEADFIQVKGFDSRKPNHLLKTSVLKTYHKGKCVYDRAKGKAA